MKHEPLTPDQLEQSEDWAEMNTCPYPLGAYLATIREAQDDYARCSALNDRMCHEVHDLKAENAEAQARIATLEKVATAAQWLFSACPPSGCLCASEVERGGGEVRAWKRIWSDMRDALADKPQEEAPDA